MADVTVALTGVAATRPAMGVYGVGSLGALSASSVDGGWAAPIGIPAPSFGITEAAPDPPASWSATPKTETAGFYYVDRTHGSASDGNTYGHPDAPRLTIPTTLAAGAYVEVHGSGYTRQTPMTFNGASTSSYVFVKGVGLPDFTGTQTEVEFRGSYWIIEGLKWVDCKFRLGNSATNVGVTFAALRGVEHTGWTGTGTTSMIAPGGRSDSAQCHDIVFHNCNIHDNGPHATGTVPAGVDIDQHGIGLGSYCYNWWILDSAFARNTGDGVQINAGSAALQATCHHIYIGRCTSTDNLQSAFWSKQANDVIISQNTTYNNRPSEFFTSGAGMGGQYGCERVWFLFNTISDSERGIHIASTSGLGSGTDVYFVGNLIYDCGPLSPSYSLTDNAGPAAITSWDISNRYYLNNTIWNCCAGIKHDTTGLGKAVFVNNIIGPHTFSTDRELWLPQVADDANSEMHHNVIAAGGSERISWNGDTVQTLAQFAAAHSPKGANCSTGTPSFVNGTTDFHLQAGDTVAQDAGDAAHAVYAAFLTLYGLSIAYDLDGNARPESGWDIGCYERVA